MLAIVCGFYSFDAIEKFLILFTKSDEFSSHRDDDRDKCSNLSKGKQSFLKLVF